MSEAPPRRRGARRLSAEELELWRSVTRHIEARVGAETVPEVAIEAAPPPIVSTVELPSRPNTPRPPAHPPLAPLDRRLRQRLARGQMAADFSLDLHGLRQDDAFRALFAFLTTAQRRGARVVLVVTGKGGRSGEPGILRRSVPLWLAATPARTLVVGFEEAGVGQGGAGALYVRLRRRAEVITPTR